MTHINQRRDTSTNWAVANPTLQLGEVGWEMDTLKAKLGDGVTAWNLLPYAIEAYDLSDYAPIDSPTFTGTPAAPTPASGDNSTKIATTKFVKDQNYVGADSPTFTGDPKVPTQSLTDNDTTIVNSAWVKGLLAALAYAGLASPTFTGDPKAPTPATADNDTSIATTAHVKAAIAAALATVGITHVQFGTTTVDIVTQSVAVGQAVTFTTAFGVGITPVVVATPLITSGGTDTRKVTISGASNTGFTLNAINNNNTTDVVATWIAIA